MYIIIRLGT